MYVYGDDVCKTVEEESSIERLLNPNALFAICEGMWAVILYSNKILQFLTGDAG